MMIVESIGDVLVRGHIGYGPRVHGNVTVVLAPETIEPYAVRGKLLVDAQCDEHYLTLIKECAGLILQNHINDIASEKFAKESCFEFE